jgi:hypothetical protein
MTWSARTERFEFDHGRVTMCFANAVFKRAAVWMIAVTAGAALAGEKPKAHICLAPAKAEVPGGVDAVTAVRDTFTSFLNGPSLSVQALTARLESQVREEAKLSDCRYLLFSTVKYTRKTTGLLGRMAAGAVQNGAAEIAAYATSSGGRIAASAASAGAGNLAMSSQVRERDQLSFQYRLEDAQGHVVSEKTEAHTAKSDAEDLLTPLVQSASESIVKALE